MRHPFYRAALAAAIFMVSAIAIAMPTEPNPCGNHGNNCNPQTPTNPGNNEQSQSNDQTQTQGQGQAQGQGQLQGQVATGGQGGRGGDGGNAYAQGGRGGAGGSSTAGAQAGAVSGSASGALSGSSSGVSTGDIGSSSGAVSSSGGNTLTGGANTASNDSSGNSSVSVDSSNNSRYTSQSLWIPDIQTAAPALVASPTLVVDRGVCGPRHEKRSERVEGTYVGILKRSKLDLGVEDELVPSAEPYRYWTDPNGAKHVFGHQVITFASVNGVAASRAIGIGGGKTGGDWGQAGASSGSSVQRTILRVQLVECELQLEPVAAEDPYIEPTVNG